MSDYGSIPPPPNPPSPYGAYAVHGTPPPNYLVWAILSAILGFLPLGIVSIVFAAQVNSKWSIGDIAGAQSASENARKFAIWAAIAQVVVLVVLGVLALLFIIMLNGFNDVN
jgi:Interferon-induced transmembrane protein.